MINKYLLENKYKNRKTTSLYLRHFLSFFRRSKHSTSIFSDLFLQNRGKLVQRRRLKYCIDCPNRAETFCRNPISGYVACSNNSTNVANCTGNNAYSENDSGYNACSESDNNANCHYGNEASSDNDSGTVASYDNGWFFYAGNASGHLDDIYSVSDASLDNA